MTYVIEVRAPSPRERIVGISRDNAANMDVAVASLGFPDTNCFGHTLQLAIKATSI